jgi:hypothetical protein
MSPAVIDSGMLAICCSKWVHAAVITVRVLEATIFCTPVVFLYKIGEGATPDEIFSSQKYYKAGSGAQKRVARHNTVGITKKKQALNYKHPRGATVQLLHPATDVHQRPRIKRINDLRARARAHTHTHPNVLPFNCS